MQVHVLRLKTGIALYNMFGEGNGCTDQLAKGAVSTAGEVQVLMQPPRVVQLLVAWDSLGWGINRSAMLWLFFWA